MFEKKLGYRWVEKKKKKHNFAYRRRRKKGKWVDDPEKREKQGFWKKIWKSF